MTFPLGCSSRLCGKIRLCGDLKLTINPASPTETDPLPHGEELFSNLGGSKNFTKLNMANAYLQLLLHPEARQVVTIKTHRGIFQYNPLRPPLFFSDAWTHC